MNVYVLFLCSTLTNNHEAHARCCAEEMFQMCVFYRPRTFHPTITTFQYISHLVCRIDMLKSRKSEQVHGTQKDTSPWYKSIEIKYAHMIAKGSAAKLTLGAPRKINDT